MTKSELIVKIEARGPVVEDDETLTELLTAFLFLYPGEEMPEIELEEDEDSEIYS